MDGPFRKRMRRRLYYGDEANLDIPSWPLTELSVEYFKDAVSQKLGHAEMDTASDLIKRNRVSPCSVVLSMMYAKRLRQRNQDYLQTMSSSDVFFISMMMASKYMYDEGVDEEVFNDEWADNTDQDIDDVNQMEVDFLKAMDWRLFVRPDEFEDAVAAIEKRLALQEGLKRGWFTYSELAILADDNLMAALWSQVGLECSKLTTVLSAAYVTGILSMLGSTALALQLAGPLSTATVTLLTLSLSPSVLRPLSSTAVMTPTPPGTPAAIVGPQTSNWSIRGDGQHVWLDEGIASPENWLGFGRESVHIACKLSKESTGSSPDLHSSSGNEGPLSMGESGGSAGVVKDVEKVEEEASGDVSEAEPAGQAHQSPSTTSLWSLLFLDSLLTQLWAVGSTKGSKVNASRSDGQHSQGVCRTRRRRRNQTHQVQPVDGLYSHTIVEDADGPSFTPNVDTPCPFAVEKNREAAQPNTKGKLKQLQTTESFGSETQATQRHGNHNYLPYNPLDPNRHPPCLSQPKYQKSDFNQQSDQPWNGLEGNRRCFRSLWDQHQNPLGALLSMSMETTIPGFHTSLPYIVQAT